MKNYLSQVKDSYDYIPIDCIQDVLGHKDVETTLNIYTDVTKELKLWEFGNLQKKMNKPELFRIRIKGTFILFSET